MQNLSLKKYQITMMIFIVLTFFIFTYIIYFQLNSEAIQKAIRNIDTEEIFIQIIKSENHFFFPNHENDFLSMKKASELFLKLAVNIKPTDARTFIITEIPGLVFYDTEIVVAGEDASLASLPYESPPPPEVLQNEKKVEEENLYENFSKEENEGAQLAPSEADVFIYHTHNIESFLPLLKDATKPSEAVSSDERANVIAIGSRLTNLLKERGIGVEHDKTNVNKELLKRNLKYGASYQISSETIQTAVANNHKLTYFIDIHRDSARKEVTTKRIAGKDYAKVYFIVGKGNKHYQKNLNFAKKLHTALEKKYQGISRGVYLKGKHEGNGVYNQDVSEKAILLEVGGVDNTLEEIAHTIDAFAEIFSEIYWEEQGVQKQ